MKTNSLKKDFYNSIRNILLQAREQISYTVNVAMVQAYWHIGKNIIEEEQAGKRRAEYGQKLIEALSKKLSKEFGKGFDPSNLMRMRQFYLLFPKSATLRHQSGKKSTLRRSGTKIAGKQQILAALRRELSWTHYKLLLRVENSGAREWYMNESADCGWSTRALERQINSFYYERLLASKSKAPVRREADQKAGKLKPENILKDPYVLEFLDLADRSSYRESELEQALIDKLQEFLLELGKGFSFVARQKRISAEDEQYYIDLVFYNYLLKCFVLIDLKTGKLTHQDIGQMDMYVRMFEEKHRVVGDNPTIGIVLCSEKNAAVARYSVLRENKRLFASKYKLYLPSEKMLSAELRQERKALESTLISSPKGRKKK